MNKVNLANRLQMRMSSIGGPKPRRALIVSIFAVGLLVRLVVLGVSFGGNADTRYYDDAKIALNLIAGRGYSIDFSYRNWLFYEKFLKNRRIEAPITEGTKPTASKQPAYPLILALFFCCFGAKNFLAVFLFQAVLSSLTAALLLLALWHVSPFVGLASGLGFALYPPFIFHSVTAPESTTLSLFLLAAFLLCWATLLKGRSRYTWALAGLIAGVEALTEPVAVPFLALCLAYAALAADGNLRRKLAGLVIAIGVVMLLVSPWLARNYLVFKRFPVLKGSAGVVFNWGLEDSGQGTWISEARIVALEYAGRNLSEIEEDEAIRHELRSLFRSHWREFLTVNVPLNFVHFWWDVRRYWDNYSVRYLLFRRLPYLLLLVLSVPAMLKLISRLAKDPENVVRESPIPVAVLILICSITLAYTIFGCYMSRYRFPVEMALILFAANSLKRMVGVSPVPAESR